VAHFGTEVVAVVQLEEEAVAVEKDPGLFLRSRLLVRLKYHRFVNCRVQFWPMKEPLSILEQLARTTRPTPCWYGHLIALCP
jgi:hypothetical protein